MIVGTAGHVDHGKTSLVRALTGIDTDRLKEEKARGITIDLGFAYMPGPTGETIGFVDVPGHERLVRTMIAGSAGIDLALLVVAADEGLMPQTREHIEILSLLGVPRRLVVITKIDRVDEARRADVLGSIADLLRPHGFGETAPLAVSARTGEGIDDLRDHLVEKARRPRPNGSDGVFRLAVDRAFTLKGVGTIVTGTALSGRVAVDEDVTLLPGARRARIRSIHIQNHVAIEGQSGDRCALAVVGVANGSVSRGAWVCGDPAPMETIRLDATLHLLVSEREAINQWTPVHLHCGASDVAARVVVLSPDRLTPGSTGFVQIVLSAPLPLRFGDRFVLRDTSARRTIGGGKVIVPRAPPRKRRTPERLRRLEALSNDRPEGALARLLALEPFVEDFSAFVVDRGLTSDQTKLLVETLDLAMEENGADQFVMTRERQRIVDDAIVSAIMSYHSEYPELPGIAGERLRQGLEPALSKPPFAAVRARLVAEHRIVARGHWLHLPSHIARLSGEDERIATLVLPLIEENRFRPPRVRDLVTMIGFDETKVRHASKALARTGALVEVAKDHFFKTETITEMACIARDLTARPNAVHFSAADFRDRLDNGRKVAIQILEYFDRHGLTHRSGDLRRVVKAPEFVFGAPVPAPGGHRATDSL